MDPDQTAPMGANALARWKQVYVASQHIQALLEIFFFRYKNAVFNGRQKKESIYRKDSPLRSLHKHYLCKDRKGPTFLSYQILKFYTVI